MMRPIHPPSSKTLAWRLRYYAFRQARDRVIAGRPAAAAEYLNGDHGPYVRERFAELAATDRRFADVLKDYAHDDPPPTKQRSPAEIARAEIARLEAELLSHPGRRSILCTPPPDLVDRLLTLLDVPAGGRILHVYAGTGVMAEQLLLADPTIRPVLLEPAIPLRELIIVRRRYLPAFDLAGGDVAHFAPPRPFDRVLLTPPPYAAADVRALPHAWRLLAPAGRLVGVMTSAAFLRPDTPSRTAAALIAAHATHPPEGEHMYGCETGEPMRLVVLNRPSY